MTPLREELGYEKNDKDCSKVGIDSRRVVCIFIGERPPRLPTIDSPQQRNGYKEYGMKTMLERGKICIVLAGKSHHSITSNASHCRSVEEFAQHARKRHEEQSQTRRSNATASHMLGECILSSTTRTNIVSLSQKDKEKSAHCQCKVNHPLKHHTSLRQIQHILEEHFDKSKHHIQGSEQHTDTG